jgi:hypothetical protein
VRLSTVHINMRKARSSLDFPAKRSRAEVTLKPLLAGGDRRSIGRSNEVVALIEINPGYMPDLVNLLWDSDPVISMRAADAVEKVSQKNGDLLQRFKPQLLDLLGECTQQEIRWHLAVIVPRLRLTSGECRKAAEILKGYLEDRSSIVKTFAMQGLFDLMRQDASLRPTVTDLIRALTRSGTAAMRARGRHLLEVLESKEFQR